MEGGHDKQARGPGRTYELDTDAQDLLVVVVVLGGQRHRDGHIEDDAEVLE